MSKSDDPKEYSGEWWASEIATAEKELDEHWRTSATKVVERYLDERKDDPVSDRRKFNIFWANTQIMKSALYATPPRPSVKRQHDDAKDDIARTAALILQRILTFGLDKRTSDMHAAFKKATEDRLVPGAGQVWLRLVTETAPIPDPTDPTGKKSIGEEVVSQKVVTEYVNWRDFIWNPARVWEEVRWVARRVWMGRGAFSKRWGEQKYKDLKEAAKESPGTYPKGFSKGRVEVYEVWCKDSNKVYFVHKGTKANLEEKDDPLKLREFWPCPKPLLATHSNDSLTPRPDYVLVQDQYEELDTLNDRINTLTRALRVVGTYDSNNKELGKLLTGPELAMIPVENWGALAEKQGMKGSTDWFPVEVIAKVLEILTVKRMELVQQIYELTGISDIMRGGSNPRETLGAQKLKAQYSSVRLQLVQGDIGEFVCEAMRIKCEIVCNHFTPEQIVLHSQVEQTESAALAQEALEVLKNFETAQFRIEISEESLSLADYTAERELRTEFLTAVGQFLSQAGQTTAAIPGSMPYLLRIVQWVAASFRGADDVETLLDEAIKNIPPPQPPAAPPPPPDHSVEVANIKAASEKEIAGMRNEAENQRHAATLTQKQQEFEAQMKIDTQLQGISQHMQQQSQDSKAQTDMNVQFMKQFLEGMKVMVQQLAQTTEMQIKAAEAQTQAATSTAQVLTQLTQSMNRKKRRVPVRDDMGDILYTEDQFIDE